jgi:biopolymer transport protein ExbD
MPLKIHHDELPTLNLTSMIDIVFLLIIFFMVATEFNEMEQDIDLEIPQVASAGMPSVSPPKPLTVAVFADGRIELDQQTVTTAELTSQLAAARQANPQVSVIIRGDARCEFQAVAGALAACREANIEELGITVHIAGQPTGGVTR